MANDNLITPLLLRENNSQPSNHQPHVSLTVDIYAGLQSSDQQHQNEVPDENNQSIPQNPFEFLGVNEFRVPATSTIDPFKNHTLKIEGVYEWVKIIVCLPIALIRLVLFGLALLIGYVATKLALQGWKDVQNPMPRWRCRIMWVTRICARCILFAFGYHWIKRRGQPVPREVAPIVVSNHVSYIEPIFFFYELFPTIVASESHDSIPAVGTIIRAMQVIYVNRFSSSSRKQAVNEIKRKASCSRFPRLLLFPEGTTSNGRALISFQLGAFIPGYPIQPVTVRYPYVHFDQSWGLISLGKLMFRMFTQFHNFMEVEYLPVIKPQENEKENAFHFAERTGHAIASSLNIVQTSHSYGDLMLLMKAAQMKQENPSSYMVEMAKVESAYRISALEAKEFLDKFLSMNPDNSGNVLFCDFLRAMRLKTCSFSEKIFAFIDLEKNGKITFKQFLLGSSYVMKHPSFRHACEVAFSKANTGGNSSLSRKELGDSVGLAIPNMTEDEITELFSMFDNNCDGNVSKDDFINCLRRNPLLIGIFSPLLRQCGTDNGFLEGEEMA
ncbi:hypothetical protein Nepgr_002403 [Nepenthes gracilis]|uniref:EF-hand domain-containing protein n=1 Tax=Nepenthes gracilis TaxID=150966 RepID=A0AAD3P9L7_NEPGR|nr:hypothetical protein Nepgr_002403 [Nepenthes gracilis]